MTTASEIELRPSDDEARELLSALTRCVVAARSLQTQMEFDLQSLKDARREVKTARDIFADSNGRAAELSAALKDESA